MDKIIQPWGYGQEVDNFPYLNEIIDEYGYRHGQLHKFASKNYVHPEIIDFAKNEVGSREHPIDKDRFIYLIVSNMGAGESWGPNINADRFSREVLSYKGNDHGVNTFLQAGIYQHHKNKDPSKSYGSIIKVVFAAPPIGMDRVESIVKIDIEKALKVGADEVVETLRKGEYPAWSMGARVAVDVCSVCGNKARTRADYCVHMKKFPRAIITKELLKRPEFRGVSEDMLGMIVCVDNPNPKFFDFSRVWIGAAPEAKTLQKVAGAHGQVMTSAELFDLLKESSGEKSAGDKSAEIEKEIPPSSTAPVGRTLSILSSKEDKISDDTLDQLSDAGIPQALSTTAGMGIVLKPSEFQRIIVRGMGRPDLADELSSLGHVFAPSPRVENMDAHLAKDFFIKALAHSLLSLVEKRSCFTPSLVRRMVVIRISRPSSTNEKKVDLDKIASMYNGYRLALVRAIPEIAETTAHLSKFASSLYEDEFLDIQAGLRKDTSPLLDKTSASYVLFAHDWCPTLVKQADSYLSYLHRYTSRFYLP